MNSTDILSQKIHNLSESATIKMAQMARDLRNQGHDVISLSLGEPDFDTPQYIKEAAIRALNEGYTKYTPVPGLLEFRQAISDKFKRDNQLDYSVDQIVVSNGAKQCIANICLSLLNDGDEVIIFTPYWVSYLEIIKFAGGIPIPLFAGIEDDFKIHPEQLAKAINQNTKAILFSSPCNPTGSVYSKNELEAIASVVKKHENIFVISDEIYEYINFGDKHASIGAIEGMQDRTITVNGMSKGFAMTGWRLGYMGAPLLIAKACAKVQGQFTSGASAFGQKAASFALNTDLTETRKMTKEFKKRRQLIIELLEDIPGIETNYPKGAFYVFPDISSFFGKSDGNETINNANDFAMMVLRNAKLAMVSGSAFGNDNCIRISYASSSEQLIEAMRRLKAYLANFQ